MGYINKRVELLQLIGCWFKYLTNLIRRQCLIFFFFFSPFFNIYIERSKCFFFGSFSTWLINTKKREREKKEWVSNRKENFQYHSNLILLFLSMSGSDHFINGTWHPSCSDFIFERIKGLTSKKSYRSRLHHWTGWKISHRWVCLFSESECYCPSSSRKSFFSSLFLYNSFGCQSYFDIDCFHLSSPQKTIVFLFFSIVWIDVYFPNKSTIQ